MNTIAAFPLFTAATTLDVAELRDADRGLTDCSRRARWATLLRPFALVVAYVFAASRGWWPLAIALFPFLFVAQVVALNDLMHRSLGLGERTTEILLSVVGLLVLESGHAIRVSHLAHHQMGGGSDDPESYVDLLTTRRLAREVPRYRFRVWAWALRHSPDHRRLMVTEMAIGGGVFAAGVVAGRRCPELALYVVLATLGCWTFPVISARGPQCGWGRQRESHALLVRGRVLPKLLRNLTFHVEHHLFPEVPSYRLPELAARLDRAFDEAGVPRIDVP